MESLFIIIGVFLIIIIFFIIASKDGDKLIKERNDKINKAIPGKAKILNFTQLFGSGKNTFGEYHTVKFSLEVSPEYKSPYTTETFWNIVAMSAPLVQQGCEVNVKIDADNDSIIYPDINSVEYSWTQAIIEAGHKKH